LNFSSKGLIAATISGTNFSSLKFSSSICSIVKPKWPPAFGPSTTTASGTCENFFAHVLKITFAALAEETITANLVFVSLRNSLSIILGIFKGKPAPIKRTSIFSFKAVHTRSSKLVSATITFNPIIPSVSFLVFLISSRNARLSSSLVLPFLNTPSPTAERTPIPPSFATVEAKPDKDIPTPIPPCTMGNFATKSPILS